MDEQQLSWLIAFSLSLLFLFISLSGNQGWSWKKQYCTCFI